MTPPAPDRPAPSGLRAVAAIAGNELRRATRDRMALFFFIALPVLIILLIGSTVGASAEESIEVGVVDLDGTEASADLLDALGAGDALEVERYDSLDDLRLDVRDDTVSAGIVVPDGYGDDIGAGRQVAVELVATPGSTGQGAVSAAVEAAVGDEAARLAAARVAAEEAGADIEDALATAGRLADEVPSLEVRTESVDEDGDGDGDGFGGFSYTAPSNLVLFVFINTIMVGALLATDRRQGLTRRMLATPQRSRTIMAGIGAAKLAFSLVQAMLIIGIGALAFGVDWGDPLGAALLVVVFAVLSTAVGLLIGTVARDAEQAQSAATPVAVGMGMLGGCMWPLDVVPEAMRSAGHLVPHAWAMDAWQSLIFDGAGVGGIATELAVLAGYAVVLGALATWRLRVTLTH